MEQANTKLSKAEIIAYLVLAMLAIAWRGFHMDDFIDNPHSWRQTDTAQYIWDFYLNGIDLLHPGVNWMGAHRVVVLEFPMPEAIVAILYHLLGPELWVARIVFLLIFLASAYYCFRICQELSGDRIASVVAILYLVMPLSQFYSRAIHIDFSAMACALGMLLFYIKWLDQKIPRQLLMCLIFLSLAFLIKAPYVFFLALPMAVMAWRRGELLLVLKRSILFALPIGIFLIWRWHVARVNVAMPDWSFIPGYMRFDDMDKWYYGTWDQRFDPYYWKLFAGRFAEYLVPLWTVPFLLAGLVKGKSTNHIFYLSWLIGAIIYFLIFFNLQVYHDYYQIPFVPILAILFAQGAQNIETWFKVPKRRFGGIMGALFCLTMAFVFTQYSEKTYYKKDTFAIETGKIIKENSQKDDLPLILAPFMDPRNPTILYRAKRYGWALATHNLHPEILEKYQDIGASQLWVYGEEELQEGMKDFLEDYTKKEFPLNHSPGKLLFLYELQPTTQTDEL